MSENSCAKFCDEYEQFSGTFARQRSTSRRTVFIKFARPGRLKYGDQGCTISKEVVVGLVQVVALDVSLHLPVRPGSALEFENRAIISFYQVLQKQVSTKDIRLQAQEHAQQGDAVNSDHNAREAHDFEIAPRGKALARGAAKSLNQPVGVQLHVDFVQQLGAQQGADCA
jgi:hypothetical protein